MRRNGCLVLITVLLISFMCPFYTWAAHTTEEFIKTDKTEYLVGEFFRVSYRFNETDETRWICFYKDGTDADAMCYVMGGTSLFASNVFGPVYLAEIGVDSDAANPPKFMGTGTYTMKVMYLSEGADYTDAASFTSGEKSHMTHTFAVRGNAELKPTISVEDRELSAGEDLLLQYKGIVNTLGKETLHVEIRDGQGSPVKSRLLWSGQYYAGISGTMAIPTGDLEAGAYSVQLVCSDSEFEMGTEKVEITVTEGVGDGSQTDKSYFPEDLFGSAESCGEYFVNADNPEIVYEQVDGEWVMHVPVHPGYDYLYTWEPVPYTHYTVTFDFYLNLFNESGTGDELDFLFDLPSQGYPFHQISIVNNSGILELLHYKHTGAEFHYYGDDTSFWDLYDEEFWCTMRVEVTPDEVSVYYDDIHIATLEDTAGCIGENGHIGIRGGSTGGWRIKNLVLTEGVTEAAPTVTPTENPTEVPETSIPSSGTPHQAGEDGTSGSSVWIWIVVVATAVVVCGAAAGFVIYRKKK